MTCAHPTSSFNLCPASPVPTLLYGRPWWATKRWLLPLPHRSACLHYFRGKSSVFLPSSTLVELCIQPLGTFCSQVLQNKWTNVWMDELTMLTSYSIQKWFHHQITGGAGNRNSNNWDSSHETAVWYHDTWYCCADLKGGFRLGHRGGYQQGPDHYPNTHPNPDQTFGCGVNWDESTAGRRSRN